MATSSDTSICNGKTGDDILQGEEFTTFFRKYYPRLMFYAMRFLDAEQAEDVVQDAFMDLWKRRDVIVTGELLGSFMYRSVYTKSINKIKRSAIINNHSVAVVAINKRKEAYFSPDNNEVIKRIEDDELGVQIHKVIESLPEKCREVFKLSYLHDMKNKEIAEVMGVSLKTIEAHMYKALKHLRGKLGHLTTLVVIMEVARLIHF